MYSSNRLVPFVTRVVESLDAVELLFLIRLFSFLKTLTLSLISSLVLLLQTVVKIILDDRQILSALRLNDASLGLICLEILALTFLIDTLIELTPC